MKVLFLSLLAILLVYKCDAQILKKLGKKIQDDAEWRVRYKADQQVTKGIDTLLEVPKKIKEKKKNKKNKTLESSAEKQDNNSNNPDKNNASRSMKASADDANDMTPKDGQITLKLSSNNVFAGGRISITGESVKYKNFNQVEISVTGPSTKDMKSVVLADDGKFNSIWIANDKTGEFTVTAKSSDKKIQQSAKFTVYSLPKLNNWCDENIDETNKAFDNLKESVAKVEESISPKDKAELENKMAEAKEKVDGALKLFKDLNTAGKQTSDLLKTAKNISPNLSANLSDLNNSLADNARQMKSFKNLTKHEPQDNTVCEYCVMVNEACAAFSAFTNFYSTSLKTIITNVALDKGVPKVVDVVNSNGAQIDAPHDFFPKEIAKIFATSKVDAESLTTKLGKAGIAGDVLQYASDVVLKTYCGIFKGEIKHDYTVDFRNNDGVTWWKYGVVVQGSLSLRYPKEGSHGKIIKMKGNFEGNATKFTFYENVEADDGFHEGSKGKIEVVELKVLKPAAFPFVSSLNDPAGFGAVARTIVTPACFNITLDAEYDVDSKKIKLFVNNALIDFSPAVVNQLIFLEVGADLLPYIKRMMFPIHPILRTLGSIVRDHNEFTMIKDSKGNLSFTGKANKHLGSKTDKIEHDLNFSIVAKKD
ncbi:MAG TPA: hypothetical protein VIL78_21010 [Hanamia sp.]